VSIFSSAFLIQFVGTTTDLLMKRSGRFNARSCVLIGVGVVGVGLIFMSSLSVWMFKPSYRPRPRTEG
jgi:hypothetical protein